MVKIGDKFRFNRKGSTFDGQVHMLSCIPKLGVVLVGPDGLCWTKVIPYYLNSLEVPDNIFKQCLGYQPKNWTRACGGKLSIND